MEVEVESEEPEEEEDEEEIPENYDPLTDFTPRLTDTVLELRETTKNHIFEMSSIVDSRLGARLLSLE